MQLHNPPALVDDMQMAVHAAGLATMRNICRLSATAVPTSQLQPCNAMMPFTYPAF